MKKLILSAILLTFLMFDAKSQILISLLLGDKLNSDKLEFGLIGGFNFTNISNLENSSTLHAFNLGFYFDIKMSDRFSFNPSVLVKLRQGAKISNVNAVASFPTGNADLDEVLDDATVERQINYFQVPLLMKYHLSPRWHVMLGPQVGLKHGAADLYQAEIFAQDDLSFEVEIKDEYKALDFGFTGGLGFRLKPEGMNLGVKYYYGLTDILKENPGAKRQNSGIYAYFTIPIGKEKAAKESGD